jgi:hypothetical protein
MWNKTGFSKISAICGLSAAAVLALAACGGGGGSSSAGGGTVSAVSYSGPGSRWDADLATDGSFTITRRDSVSAPVDLTVNGSYESLASGFLKLTVASASGTDAPSAGDVAYALDVPGYALMLKPMDAGNDQIIPMVRSGECPTIDMDANWVMVKKDDGVLANDAGREFFGTFHFDVASGTPSLPNSYNLTGFTDLGAGTITAGTCADGIMNVSDAVMYLTSNGGAIVRTGVNDADPGNDSFIFGLEKKAVGSLANTDAEYAGWLFDENQASGAKISPVSVSCTSSGSCTGNIVQDIDNNALDMMESVSINLSMADDPGTGLISASIASSEPGSVAGNMACMADGDALGTGKKVVSCVGQSPGDVSRMFNILLVSKD